MLLTKSGIQEIVLSIQQMNQQENEAVMILLAYKDHPPIEDLISELNERSILYFGGIFPGIIYKDQSYEEGAILIKLPLVGKPYAVRGLDKEDFEVPLFNIKQHPSTKLTAVILLDGFSAYVSNFLDALYNAVGDKVNFIGAGAGYLSLEQRSSLFTKEGLAKNLAIVALVDLKVSLGVRHGWTKLAGPIVATRTAGNELCELNWQSAYSVYKEVVENDIHEIISSKNFNKIIKNYPFVMYKEGTEGIVRDTIGLGSDGSLLCLGNIPENSIMYILKGDRDTLIEAARKAAKEGVFRLKNELKHSFVVECLSRSLFLEDDLKKELQAISEEIPSTNEQSIPQGVLSLGEISSYGTGLLEFFNRSTVIGLFSE